MGCAHPGGVAQDGLVAPSRLGRRQGQEELRAAPCKATLRHVASVAFQSGHALASGDAPHARRLAVPAVGRTDARQQKWPLPALPVRMALAHVHFPTIGEVQQPRRVVRRARQQHILAHGQGLHPRMPTSRPRRPLRGPARACPPPASADPLLADRHGQHLGGVRGLRNEVLAGGRRRPVAHRAAARPRRDKGAPSGQRLKSKRPRCAPPAP